jgi:hypothetical protein
MSFRFPFPVDDEVARVLDSGLPPASAREAGLDYTGPVAYWRGERYGVVAYFEYSDGTYKVSNVICELHPDGVWVLRGGGGCDLTHHPADLAGERWAGRRVDWAAGVSLEGEAAATIGWASAGVVRIEARVAESAVAHVDIESSSGAFVIGVESPVDAEFVALDHDSNPVPRPDGTIESLTVTAADPF